VRPIKSRVIEDSWGRSGSGTLALKVVCTGQGKEKSRDRGTKTKKEERLPRNVTRRADDSRKNLKTPKV